MWEMAVTYISGLINGIQMGFYIIDMVTGLSMILYTSFVLWLHSSALLYDMNYLYMKKKRIVYDSGSKIDAKLASVIKGKSWCWPPARSEELVNIQSQLPLVQIGEVDHPIWSIEKRVFIIWAETWETTWLRFPPVNWWRIFWFNLAIPRHAFILWLAMQDSLVTWEKMMRWGYGGNVKCVFCKGCIEGRQHLFSHVD
jgi:hypothetical protein